MAGHEWEDWFEREEFIGQISDLRVQNLQVEREVVQKRTFTRWMNLHLEKCDPPTEVQDLFQDIQDGRILMALLEELSGCKLLHGFKKSSHRIFRLNNIAKVLSFLEERNVKLVSIDAADVADGNSSIILGLIWNIILFFQIKELTGNIRSQFPSTSSLSSIPTSLDSDSLYCSTPSDDRRSAAAAMREHSKAIKKLLQWVQKRTRKYGVAVQDFGKSWTSGLAFLAVIKSIDPSLVDMRKALLRSPRENLEDAFRIAHYSLGIPRLLEPEDVILNTPDEQSTIMYVSQFLEHFPGIEEPEEHHQLIERSVSMGRLNFRDSDSDHMRRGVYFSRVKERSYMFQRDCTQPPPNILISSISEDRAIISPRLRVAAARSWSSEDFLSDSPQVDDTSCSVHEDPKDPASEVLTSSNSPQLLYAHSPTASSMPESVTNESLVGDSAISSPDSWVDSEFGLLPEKFCESRSDSSLCDSGTAWDVYRATPVEVMPLDEGFIPSIEDRAPEDQSMTESYTDEGIYSLSSLESAQDRVQGLSEKKQVEAVKEKEVDPENHEDLAGEQGPHQTRIIKEVDSEQTNESHLQKDRLPREAGAEEPVEQISVQDGTDRGPESIRTAVDVIWDAQDHEGQVNGRTESLKKRNDSEVAEVETNSVSEHKEDVLKERSEAVAEAQAEARYHPDSQETNESETLTQSDHREEASKFSLSSSMDMNIPLIAISSEPEEQDEGGGPEGPGHAEDEDLGQQRGPGGTGTDTEVSPQSPHGLSREDELPSCLKSKHVELSEQIRDTGSDHLDTEVERCGPDTAGSMDISEARQERQSPRDRSQAGSDSTAAKTVNREQDTDSADGCDGHQDRRAHICSDSETQITQLNTPDPVHLKPNGNIEPASVSRIVDLFPTDFDRSSPTEDLVGDPLEPMDLFYPDKEEPVFTDTSDTEMQSWPSVLSVSALQPAPPSDTLSDDQLLNLLGEDFRDLIDEQEEVSGITTNQKTDAASEPQEQCLLPGEEIGGLLPGDAPANSSNLSQADQQSPVSSRDNTEAVRVDTQSSSRQDEGLIPPVLRHRKGARFPESTDGQRAVPRTADDHDSDVWCSSELYLLLLLWLLLYCFWLLPQMDLRSLPSLLLNR